MSSNDPNQPGQPYNPTAGSANPNSNPYGENPYGTQPAPYGQNPGQPAPQYQQYPQQGGYAPIQPPTERPKTLRIAFVLILLAGVFSAISSWLLNSTNFIGNVVRSQWALFEEQMRTQMESGSDPAVNAEMEKMLQDPDTFVSQISSTMVVFTMVGIVLTLVAYFLVGYFVGRGVGAMRIIATVLGALSIISLLSTLPMVALYANSSDAMMINVVFTIGVVLGLIGVVFAWLPESSKYIAARKMARRAGYR